MCKIWYSLDNISASVKKKKVTLRQNLIRKCYAIPENVKAVM